MFTPKGDLVTLPKDATVLDLAYNLHSEIGSHAIAGKVNHRLVPISYKLQSGDQVEVLTSKLRNLSRNGSRSFALPKRKQDWRRR